MPRVVASDGSWPTSEALASHTVTGKTLAVLVIAIVSALFSTGVAVATKAGTNSQAACSLFPSADAQRVIGAATDVDAPGSSDHCQYTTRGNLLGGPSLIVTAMQGPRVQFRPLLDLANKRGLNVRVKGRVAKYLKNESMLPRRGATIITYRNGYYLQVQTAGIQDDLRTAKAAMRVVLSNV